MRTALDVKLSTQDRRVTVYSADDVEPILERNKTLRALEQKSDWGRHIASIPNIVMVKWLNEAWRAGNEVQYLERVGRACRAEIARSRLCVSSHRHEIAPHRMGQWRLARSRS